VSDTAQHAVIEALVDLWNNALDVPVYDGPNAVEEAEYAAVWVGYDPTDDNAQAVESSQTWAELGNRAKNEEGTITCAVAAWSGDSTTIKRRQRVAELLSELETALRADLTLSVGTLIDTNFGERITLHQQLTEDGNEVLALFTVDYRARI
jgi:hypothetical protein